jgi:cohesin complex subunit SA-1/2
VISGRLDPETDETEDLLVGHAMSLMLGYFMWKCLALINHFEEGTSLPDDDLTVLVERRDACVATLIRIIESRKGADDVRLGAANLLLDVHFMFHAIKVKKSKTARTPKKPQGRGHKDANEDWEALCQDVDGKTTKMLLQILTAAENNLSKLTNKKLEEPDVDDDPVDPDDEPESDEEADENEQQEKQRRIILADQALCTIGGNLVKAVLIGMLGTEGSDAVRKRLERNKLKLTPQWKECVNQLDAIKLARKGTKAAPKPAKETSKTAKSKTIVVEDDSDEEEEDEVPGDEIEDEEMADGDEEQANGVEHGDMEKDADEESILGD